MTTLTPSQDRAIDKASKILAEFGITLFILGPREDAGSAWSRLSAQHGERIAVAAIETGELVISWHFNHPDVAHHLIQAFSVVGMAPTTIGDAVHVDVALRDEVLQAPVPEGTVTAGDQVMVDYGQPGHNMRIGQVVSVGRVWIYVEVRGYGSLPLRFRIDNQTDGSGMPTAARYYTPAQWVAAKIQTKAFNYLRDQGITLKLHSPWHGRETELAEILRQHQP